MSPERFDVLLGIVEPLITKEITDFRDPISPAERLSLTLWFLATGESQQSLSFSYRIGKAAVSKIVRETCDAIYNVLSPIYLATPSMDDWVAIAEDFEETWNLQNVKAAIALHNYLQQAGNAMYCPQGFVDSESANGEILPGHWRTLNENRGLLSDLPNVRGSRYSDDAKDMRESLKEYVNSASGQLPWQLDHVRRT